jgi:hypothetical protein
MNLICMDVVITRDEEKYGEVFVQALQVMLLEGRQHDMQRAAGFIKRLSSLALHLGPAEAMAGTTHISGPLGLINVFNPLFLVVDGT